MFEMPATFQKMPLNDPALIHNPPTPAKGWAAAAVPNPLLRRSLPAAAPLLASPFAGIRLPASDMAVAAVMANTAPATTSPLNGGAAKKSAFRGRKSGWWSLWHARARLFFAARDAWLLPTTSAASVPAVLKGFPNGTYIVHHSAESDSGFALTVVQVNADASNSATTLWSSEIVHCPTGGLRLAADEKGAAFASLVALLANYTKNPLVALSPFPLFFLFIFF